MGTTQKQQLHANLVLPSFLYITGHATLQTTLPLQWSMKFHTHKWMGKYAGPNC